MSKWEVAFSRAVGLLWLCLAQTGEAGDSLGLGMMDLVLGILYSVFGLLVQHTTCYKDRA